MVLSCYNTVPNKDAMKKQILPPNKAQRKLPNNKKRARRRKGGREGGGRDCHVMTQEEIEAYTYHITVYIIIDMNLYKCVTINKKLKEKSVPVITE